jgi:signal transduction histidine kinase
MAAVYFGSAKLGFSLTSATHMVTAVWPPAGLAVGALLLFGYRIWPGILLGAFIANADRGVPLATTAGIALGNMAGPLLAALMLRRIVKVDRQIARLRDVLGLVVYGAMAAMTVTATNGVAQMALRGIIPWSAYLSVWWTWWVGDAMGVLLITPFVLTWATGPRMPWRGLRLVELTVLFLAVVGICFILFFSWGAPRQVQYGVFPLVIWAALRFSQRETSTVVLVVAVLAVWSAARGGGPFSTGTLDERLVLLDGFLAVVSVTALSLGAVTGERSRAEGALQRAHAELEARVRERTAELAAANAELARKNEEVEGFVYIVSHDLRAPLVNLQGFSQELEHSCKQLDEKLRAVALPASVAKDVDFLLKDEMLGALRYISASTAKFHRLIDALLSLSRLGQQKYRREEVDVGAVVASTLDCLRQQTERGGARIEVQGSLPTAVGDATAIGQVFSNLIGNALNYLSPERSGLIEVGGKVEDGMAHYWVKDNGVGIPANAQQRMFQVFQRFHPELAPGEGMGLAIAKRVVERHGGKIWAESEVGVGTTFHVTLHAPDP